MRHRRGLIALVAMMAVASSSAFAQDKKLADQQDKEKKNIRKVVDDVVLVSDEQMIDAIRHLYKKENVLAEPAGAAATAAYLANPISGRVVLLVSGSNIADDVRQQAGIAL